MTTAEKWKGGRLGHYGPLLLLVGVNALMVALSIVVFLFMVVALVGYLLSVWHPDHLCGLCIDAFPADGQHQAAVHGWWLRLRHRRWVNWWLVLLPIGLSIFLLDGYADHVALLIGYSAATLTGVAEVRHNRLRPWCPLCRGWDDDGDAPAEPSPVPPSVKADR